MSGVPVLEMSAPSFVDELHESLATYGFVGLVGHGVSDERVMRCEAATRELFALPLSVKQRHETPEDGRQRGYTGLGVEHARDASVADLKEFWHVGRDGVPELSANQFPDEVPGFANVALDLFSALDELALTLLDAIARGLSLPADWFTSRVIGGNNVLRLIHYPPVGPDIPAGAVRAAAHEDINLITLLPVASEPGLEIRTHEGGWVAVSPPPGTIVLDTGDMMQLVTGGRMPATTHRVVNPPFSRADRPRYSMPFFVHPRPTVRLDPIDGGPPGPMSEEFLLQRLRQTGVIT